MNLISTSEQVRNWLTTIMEQSQNTPVSEFFYFDGKDGEFFSILTIDYFLFEEDWTIPEGTSSSYSEDVILILADRMQRIEKGDPSIIYIPPKGLSDLDEIKQEIETFLIENSIDINNTRVWEVGNEGESQISMDLTVNSSNDNVADMKKKWWKFWK